MVRRRRTGELRTRSGCIRCRQRRVKCPEEKPSCAQCLTKGFKCSYNVQLRWQPAQEFKGTSLPVKQLVKDYMFLHASSVDFEDSTPTPFLQTSSALTESPDRSLDRTFSHHTECGDGITLEIQLCSSPIAISSVELDLWHYFSVAIAPACVLDPAVNPYRDIILRIAHPGDKTSPVFNIIMAIAAQEKAILGGPKYHSIAMRYYNEAVRTLRLEIIRLDNGLSDQASKASILATVMALVFLDIMSKCSNWWVVHSNFARSLVHKFRSIQPSYDPDQDALLNFVGGYVVVHEVYAHTAWDATEPDTYNEPITSMCDDMNLKTLTGCSTEFLQILADINSLAADFYSYSRLDKVDPETLCVLEYRRHDLEGRLRETGLGNGTEASENDLTVELKRLTGLLHLYSRLDHLGPHDPGIATISPRILNLIERVPARSNIILWPLFMVATLGIGPECDADRAFILHKLDQLQRKRQMKYIKKARDIIVEIWKLRDLGEAYSQMSWDILAQVVKTERISLF